MFKWLFCTHDYLTPTKTRMINDSRGRLVQHISFYKCSHCGRTVKRVTNR